MAGPNQRDVKIIQYLAEAYGKEKELETALQAHIAMTTRDAYKKRLRGHLKETKDHGRQLERRIKQLGGGGQTIQSLTGRAMAAAKGPMHALRGTGEQEKMLKNAKTEYSDEHEEIATYAAIEALAERAGDRDTAKMAKGIRRDEERMANFLERLIPQLTKSVATESIPRDQLNGGPSRRSGRRRQSRGRSRSSSTRSRSRSRSTGTRSNRTTSRRSGSSSRSRSGASRSRQRARS
jgi:ferritin-like metal-binding protein YciE